MEIYIPTYGRVDRQITYDNLPKVWQDQITFVVYEEEAPLHVERGRKVWVYPPDKERGIGNKRKFIRNESLDPHICTLDDDLVFSARRTDDPTKFRKMTDHDYDQMFDDVRVQLDNGYMHGAIAMREGANRNTEPYLYCTRALRAHFYNQNAPFQYVSQYMQDFTMTLDLLTQGHPNVILNRWVHNQPGSNVAGGCSDDRSLEKLAHAARVLKYRHPDFVTVVTKETKGSWGGGKRTDVRIQWKKAFKEGQEYAISKE
jgi:hypothetical protein